LTPLNFGNGVCNDDDNILSLYTSLFTKMVANKKKTQTYIREVALQSAVNFGPTDVEFGQI